MKEQEVQKKITDKLKEIGCYVVKTIVTNESGTPDIFACYDGKFIAIEVKKEGQRPSKLQQYKLDKIKEAGGIAFWCDSYNYFIERFTILTGYNFGGK